MTVENQLSDKVQSKSICETCPLEHIHQFPYNHSLIKFQIIFLKFRLKTLVDKSPGFKLGGNDVYNSVLLCHNQRLRT